MRSSLILSFFLTCSATFSQTLPTDNGVYLQNAEHWDKLYLASTSGTHSSGIAKSAFTYGIASAKVVLVFRGATAPAQTTSTRPSFHIVGPNQTAPRDIVIVRLKQKKDSREIQVAKVGAYTGVNFEYPPSETTAVDFKESKDGIEVTPHTDLKDGEYILFTATPTAMPTGYGGYDFSVIKEGKR